jgi:hypothetical protein
VTIDSGGGDIRRRALEPARVGIRPLHRPTWPSLSQPYWLAKRRIPEWLPIAPSRDALESL